ncbi:MAG: NAD(P)/FAD-dependent oxidoreductase [Actinomycetota bacterium]|nr:NAD(P)/FAD-dependent oxidoreductase [Actinomycetota bacterium]
MTPDSPALANSEPAGRRRPQVVVVGGGFGGIAAARALRSLPVDVTLVDRHNYHGFWPLLYQVATAALGPGDIAHNLRGIFWGDTAIDARMAAVTGVDLDARRVDLDTGPPLSYDWLILAAGSVNDTFGVPGVADNAFPLKSLPDAMALRNHLLEHFEWAHTDPSLVDAGFLTVVVAGGGPTGVEVSGALSELFRVLERDFPVLVGRATVILVEMGAHLLNGFHRSSQAEALRTLRARGVEVHLRTRIAEARCDGVTFEDGSVIPTRTLVWAAGVRANPLADNLGVEQGRAGTVTVADDLSIPGHPEVFVIGDMAAASDAGRPLPMVAPVAQQGARHAAASIGSRLAGRPTRPFHYRDKGKMATIGRRAAVADLPLGIRLGGTPAWLSWLALHLVLLVGFRNRATVLLNWAWNYVTWDRGNRVILRLRGDSTDAR